jgi:hypothetical protein
MHDGWRQFHGGTEYPAPEATQCLGELWRWPDYKRGIEEMVRSSSVELTDLNAVLAVRFESESLG